MFGRFVLPHRPNRWYHNLLAEPLQTFGPIFSSLSCTTLLVSTPSGETGLLGFEYFTRLNTPEVHFTLPKSHMYTFADTMSYLQQYSMYTIGSSPLHPYVPPISSPVVTLTTTLRWRIIHLLRTTAAVFLSEF